MKISDKSYKWCIRLYRMFPIIYVLITEKYNLNKFSRFFMITSVTFLIMALGIGHKLSNKPIKKKDLIELILGNLFICSLLIFWYIRFVL